MIKKPAAQVTVQQLRCFAAIAETRHLGRAAERLHLTQPAISKALSTLESIVGWRLFDRGRQGARLTRDGERFLPRAVAVLDALEHAGGAMSREDGAEADLVHVGALPSVAPDLLPGAIETFGNARPSARVSLRTAANAPLLDALKTGAVDLVVGRMSDPSSMAGLTFELLYLEPLTFVVKPGHPLQDEPGLSLRRVVEFPLVLLAQGTVPRLNTDSLFELHGVRPRVIRLETLSVSVARLYVQRTEAVWIVPVGAVREDLLRGTLVRLELPVAATDEPVGLLRRRDDVASESTAEFIDALRHTAATRATSVPRVS